MKTEIIKKKLLELAYELSEKRSDIAEVLINLAENGELDLSLIEHRYISARIPLHKIKTDEGVVDISYDTLTTHIEFIDKDNQWRVAGNEVYSD